MENAAKGYENGFNYSAPDPTRSWVGLNYGRILWPKLDGYKILDQRYRKQNQKKTALEIVQREELMSKKQTGTGTEAEPAEPVEMDTAELPSASLEVKSTPTPRTGLMGLFKSLRRSPKKADSTEPDHTHPADPVPESQPLADHEFVNSIDVEEADKIDHQQLSPDSSADQADYVDPDTGIPWYSYVLDPGTIPNRYDLRFKGIGFVLDLSRGRSEQAVRQEVYEWVQWEEAKRTEASRGSPVIQEGGTSAPQPVDERRQEL